MKPDTNLGGIITTQTEVFYDKTTSLFFSRKLSSAKLVLDDGYSFPEAARSLEVGETALRRWVKQLQEERGGTTPNSKALTPEQLEFRLS